MKRYPFKKEHRLKGKNAFRNVFSQGKLFRGQFFTIYVLHPVENEDSMGKIGISVRSTVGTAVERNRLKRSIREIYRLNRERLAEGTKIVLKVDGKAAGQSYQELESAFVELCREAGILKNP